MFRILTLVLSLSALAVSPALAASHANPCNPCRPAATNANPCSPAPQANPCNPCAMPHATPPANPPANPCAMPSPKKPANPCNPCAMPSGQGTSHNTPIRPHAFDTFQQAVALGQKLWSDDEHLGENGVSCLSCHSGFDKLHFEANQNFPHFVPMTGDVVTLDQMINYCLLNPMGGKALDPNSREMTAMAAFYRAYRLQYLQGRVAR